MIKPCQSGLSELITPFECVNPKNNLASIFTRIYTFCQNKGGGGGGRPGPPGPSPRSATAPLLETAIPPQVYHRDQPLFTLHPLQRRPHFSITNLCYFLVHNSHLFYSSFSFIFLIQVLKVLFPSSHHTSGTCQYISISIPYHPNLLHVIPIISISLPRQFV